MTRDEILAIPLEDHCLSQRMIDTLIHITDPSPHMSRKCYDNRTGEALFRRGLACRTTGAVVEYPTDPQEGVWSELHHRYPMGNVYETTFAGHWVGRLLAWCRAVEQEGQQ